jgi:hypothetical protein
LETVVVIPVAWRPRVAAIGLKLRSSEQSGWDGDFWDLTNRYREA